MDNFLLIVFIVIVLLLVLKYKNVDYYTKGHRPALQDFLPTAGYVPEQGGYVDIGEAPTTPGSELNTELCEECVSHCMGWKAHHKKIKGFHQDTEDCKNYCDNECRDQY